MAQVVRYDYRNEWDAIAELVPQLFNYYSAQRDEQVRRQFQSDQQADQAWLAVWTQADPKQRDWLKANAPQRLRERFGGLFDLPASSKDQLEQLKAQETIGNINNFNDARNGGTREIEVPVQPQPNEGLGLGFAGPNQFQSFVDQGMQEGRIPTSYTATVQTPGGDPGILDTSLYFQSLYGANPSAELTKSLNDRELLGRDGASQIARVAGGLDVSADTRAEINEKARQFDVQDFLRESEAERNRASAQSSLASAENQRAGARANEALAFQRQIAAQQALSRVQAGEGNPRDYGALLVNGTIKIQDVPERIRPATVAIAATTVGPNGRPDAALAKQGAGLVAINAIRNATRAWQENPTVTNYRVWQAAVKRNLATLARANGETGNLSTTDTAAAGTGATGFGNTAISALAALTDPNGTEAVLNDYENQINSMFDQATGRRQPASTPGTTPLSAEELDQRIGQIRVRR